MIYNLDLLGIGDAIRQALRTLSGRIAALIYELIDNLYVVFIYISKAEILEASFIEQIYTKVGMILGIFMVFKLTFSLIQALIEPEKLNDQKKGFSSIISRSVIAIVLLGITPSLFREAFKIQNLIVGSENSNNIIYKLIVGNNVSGNFKDMGRRISSDLYFSFFRDDNYPYLNNGAISNYGSNDRFPIDNYDNLVTNIEEKKVINGHEMGFDDTVDYLAIKFGNIYCIEYNEIFSIAFGLVVAWMFISYCIQVGARVVQLAYLQLIAPVPILSYISDPEGSFKKWISQCVTTYLDLFIRLAIIYFVMTAISDVLDQFNKASGVIFTSTGLDATDKGMFILVKIFIILGLLMFAKKVPELLKDLFPNLGGGAASLGFGPKLPKEVSGFAKGAATLGLGAVVGGAAGLATGIKHGEGIKGKIAGAFGGLGRGMTSSKTKGNIFKNAQAGMNSTRAARQRAYEKNHDGSTWWGRNFTPGGNARTKDEFDREINKYDEALNATEVLKTELDKDARVIYAKSNFEGFQKDGIARTMMRINGHTYNVGDTISGTDKIEALRGLSKSVEKAQRTALEERITHRDSKTLSLLSIVDAHRASGKKAGYIAFGADSMMDTSLSASDRATIFFDNEKNVKREKREIKDVGGSRNEAYKRAAANAKYNKSGK